MDLRCRQRSRVVGDIEVGGIHQVARRPRHGAQSQVVAQALGAQVYGKQARHGGGLDGGHTLADTRHGVLVGAEVVGVERVHEDQRHGGVGSSQAQGRAQRKELGTVQVQQAGIGQVATRRNAQVDGHTRVREEAFDGGFGHGDRVHGLCRRQGEAQSRRHETLPRQLQGPQTQALPAGEAETEMGRQGFHDADSRVMHKNAILPEQRLSRVSAPGPCRHAAPQAAGRCAMASPRRVGRPGAQSGLKRNGP
ncbi:hypothetical protein IP87_12195 [beta proteobacterium AAP121]|nr:hypothetical protein IP80_09460 [beta proteobacterium AAP65]KPF97140.1 hypothetical protein IP87_12195 [beta proteobacterium AAP121]